MSKEKLPGISYGIVLLAMLGGGVLGFLLCRDGMQRNLLGHEQKRITCPRGDLLERKMNTALKLIREEYVEEIDEDSVAEGMLNAMLLTLDPHSRYVGAENFEKEMELLAGGFEGVGMTLRRQKDTTCVSSVFPGGPAAKAGLLPGDRIVRVDTMEVCGPGVRAEEVVNRIRGKRGSEVSLWVVRRNVEGRRCYRMRRAKVEQPSMNYSCMLGKGVGYVKLSSFTETTHTDFHKALAELKGEGMKHLVLDLRGNGGGLLEAAVKVCGELLEKGLVIVETKGAHSRPQTVRSPGGGIYTEGALTVMIDEYSASASEIVSGAVQDNDRGRIVGRRSFGKGLVQRQFPLDDGSAIMLTIAKYYTPSGRCIQRPYSEGAEAYYLSNMNQMVKDYLSDSIAPALTDTVPYRTRNGRIVYGGGGIVPDRIIPMRQKPYSEYFNSLVRKEVLVDYAGEQVALHVGELLKRYPTETAFDRGFQVGSPMVEELVRWGEKAGVKCDRKGLEADRKEIVTLVKGYMAESLYGQKGFYKEYIHIDYELNTLLEELGN